MKDFDNLKLLLKRLPVSKHSELISSYLKTLNLRERYEARLRIDALTNKLFKILYKNKIIVRYTEGLNAEDARDKYYDEMPCSCLKSELEVIELNSEEFEEYINEITTVSKKVSETY